MKRICALVLLVIASASLASGQDKKDYRDEKVERELKELVRVWDAAIVGRDAATLDRLLADEFTLSGVPKARYLEFVKSPAGIVSAVSDNFDVRVYKDMAVLIAVDTIKSKRDGVEVVERYRFIDVWVKRGGRWQCVSTESCEIKN